MNRDRDRDRGPLYTCMTITTTMLIVTTLLIVIGLSAPCRAQQENETKPSCEGRCGEAYFPNKPCYCNEACIQFENCCFDYLKLCNPDAILADEWHDHEGHSYRFYEDNLATAVSAARRCADQGALLVSLNSHQEADFVARTVLRMSVMSVFIGGTDEGSEGRWRWADGQPMPGPGTAGSLWYPGQPDDGAAGGGGEHCSLFTRYKFWASPKVSLPTFYWADHACGVNAKDVQGYICERTLQCDSGPCQNNATCRYAPSESRDHAEFVCDCRPNYYGARCQTLLKPGATWTQCGSTSLSGPSGRLTSPLYPLEYPPRADCTWTIRVEEGHTVALRINHLDLEQGKNCVFDSLVLYDGGSTQAPVLLGPLCGSRQFKKDIFSSTNEVVLSFKSDDTIHLGGFDISYTENECSTGVGDSGCGTVGRFNSSCGRIQVRQGSDRTDGRCEWGIDVPLGAIVNITFNEFSIQDTGMGCDGGALAVYDGADATSRLLGRYCGLQFPWSLQSSSSSLYLRLENVDWESGTHGISMEYNALDEKQWLQTGSVVEAGGRGGKLSSEGLDPTILTDQTSTYKWLVKVTPGSKVNLTWMVSSEQNVTLKIYDGSREDCQLAADTSRAPYRPSGTGSFLSTTFSVLVVVTKVTEDDSFVFTANYTEQDWLPELSGCYRPAYSALTSRPETENTVVTSLEPVVLTVSDHRLEDQQPVYQGGMYCKWRIQGGIGSQLSLRLLSMNIQPQDADCSVDGLVVYSGTDTRGTMYGPFCGTADSVDSTTLDLPTSDMVVVFYSSTINRNRVGGVLRALVSAKDNESESCRTDQLGDTKSKIVKSSCGILLSPNFPGSVPPEVWTWFIETPLGAEGGHLVVYLYYVRGPAVQSTKCSEYFKLFEVPKDSSTLRHYETKLLKLCEDTDLFIPEENILLPPYQKLGVELSTATSALYQRWQFKLAYKTDKMVPPKHTKSDTEGCPSGHYYHYYRGHCYKLYQWALRHYESNEGRYDFAGTWQRSLDHCQTENGTLLSIKDEEEAYYIQYMLSHAWFWDPIGTFQTNHRLIFLGLHNRDFDYKWTDGTSLAYSDWYWPRPALYTPPVYPDTDPSTADLLHTNLPQPTADSGSLCTVLIPLSPHSPLNWAKVPCDYPFSRTSAICKSPAAPLTAAEGQDLGDNSNRTQDLESEQVVSTTETLRDLTTTGYKACTKGWLSTRDRCLMLHTNYATLSNSSSSDQDFLPLSYVEGERVCHTNGGEVMTFDPYMMSTVRELLNAWGHSEIMGGVWMARDGRQCKSIQVSRTHRLDTALEFTVTGTDCADPAHPIYNVLCQANPIERREACRRDEFTCHNLVCVSVDSVCDGVNDCFDGSDEIGCECGPDYFRCADGNGCVPVSLFCDFVPHCKDESDETNCVDDQCKPDQFTCGNGECIDQSKVCDFVVDCVDRTDEVPDTCVGQCRGFQCYSGQCLRADLQEDLVADCAGLQREDEVDIQIEPDTAPHKDQIGHTKMINSSMPLSGGSSGVLSLVSEGRPSAGNQTRGPSLSCSDPDHVQCREGEPRCFPRAALCVYDTALVDPVDQVNVMTACRNGRHLSANCDVADCPGMYRCPASYCIPYSKVCDGIRDCPRGHDEASCQDYTCPGLLRCKGETHCVPHDKVCDGQVNCPLHGEDEKYCHHKDVACVEGCNCTGNVVSCTDMGLTSLPEPDMTSSLTRSLRALLLSGNKLTLTSQTLVKLHWLGRLDLSRNNLEQLPEAMFSDLKNLFELDLSYNMIHTLDGEAFSALVSLKFLNLHGNQLSILRIDTLGALTSLTHLVLTGNKLADVSQDAFDGLQALETINTDAYKFCCIAKHVQNCTPEPDEFSSCEDLMSNSALQVSIWVLGVLALVGNVFVMAWRLHTDRTRISSFFIINLGCSDLLMGVYMLIIASVDVFYRGRYILHADAWRSSGLCKAAGVVAMVSSEVSVFMLTAITADRFVNFVFPLKANKFRLKHARVVAGVGWAVCIVISVVPSLGLPYFGDAFFGRTGVCLPFHLSDERLPGWEYSVFIFLVLNFISFVAIFIGYVTIFVVVSRSARAVQSTSSLDEYSLAKKLALIIGTDLACWVPIILIGFAALAGAQVSPQVAAWVAVFVLPLNSAINPLLYTVSAIDFSRIFRRKSDKTVSNGQTSVSIVSTKA